MKQITIQQSNYTDLFEKETQEPILVKNSQGKPFLILPLEEMHWRQIFFYLYQLPDDLFEIKPETKRDIATVKKICGSMKNYLSNSDDFAKSK